MKFDVAAILINYNSSDFTLQCIDSIVKNTTSLNYQIIVTDNASDYEDYQKLKLKLSEFNVPNLILSRSKINTGFGGGNMHGIQLANARYYAFINNDSVFVNDCLSIMFQTMESNSEIGISGPLCYNEKGKLLPTIDYFASPWKDFLGRNLLHKINPKAFPNRKKIPDEPQKGPFVAGSFMMIKSENFHRVGGFDTNLFLYFEETDLCLRLRRINKFAFIIPEAQFIHYHGVSTPRSFEIKKELNISKMYLFRKHYGFFWHKIMLIYFSFKYFFSALFKPNYWSLFILYISGAPLSKSLKQKQKIWEF